MASRIQEKERARESRLALAMRLGVMFAPGIVIDGVLASYGRPSERRLRRDIDKRLALRTLGGSA